MLETPSRNAGEEQAAAPGSHDRCSSPQAEGMHRRRSTSIIIDRRSRNDGSGNYKLSVKDVPVDGFWSVTVYDATGHFQKNNLNAYSLNNITAKKRWMVLWSCSLAAATARSQIEVVVGGRARGPGCLLTPRRGRCVQTPIVARDPGVAIPSTTSHPRFDARAHLGLECFHQHLVVGHKTVAGSARWPPGRGR